MKVFAVFHDYGTDGGFGDYVPVSDLIAIFSSREKAEEFVKKFSKPHIYDRPYCDLDCGNLQIGEVTVDEIPDEKSESTFWWLHNGVLD